MPQPYDLITMGRIGVDLYPLQTGVPLAQVQTFGKYLGGSASNVAVAAARLGRRTAVVTRTGRDAFGDYLHQALREFGVDDRWVTAVPGLPTPVTFCEIFPPDDFPLYFYRQPKAPDLELRAGELDMDAIGRARVLWTTGTGLCAEPSREATLAALEYRAKSGTTVLDLDWRPMFWAGPTGSAAEQARPVYAKALAHATVAVGNLEECEIATGEREPHAAAAALLACGVELAVVKQGPAGVLAARRDGTVAEVAPVRVDVVNGLGAGDAFGGAMVHGLIAGWELERVMRFANAAGAIVAARLACSSAMPYPAEVDALLDGHAPGAEARPEPRGEARPEARSEPRGEARPEPRPGPRPGPDGGSGPAAEPGAAR
ncbi:5-dehydro-2-deoxygluconokinase [Streptomyces spongiicola]|uniref:5-dehydro-2-deoxygluconokinase n=1 Tax=Streptomyces spongiicola TaxID=1690221 RepID=A0A388SVV2_9ACTN|nr:5-dehydro-2-deoxygluconokinase [Streptomyces spongiicola]GBP99970.1 5-dehydro-2-deoxygluconokinase [Streptomyces spongiicola]